MSQKDVGEHSQRNATNEYAVVLPCRPDEFRDFISGLLGKPQTITKQFHGPFELTKHDVENFYHLVVQRVQQQNEATLIQYTVTIVYDDDSTVLLNSFDDFERYSEVRPVTSVGVNLAWTFLVRFQDRRVVEKQQIDVSISAEHSIHLIHEEAELPLVMRSLPRGTFTFRITHTARTWGADIEALLTGHIENLIKKVHPCKRFIINNSARIGLGVGTLLFLSSMTASFYTTQKYVQNRTSAVRSIQSSSAKVDYLVDLVASGAWPRFFFYLFCFLFIALVLSIIFGIWAGDKADTQEPSFILLSRQAEQYRQKRLAANRKSWRSFALSIIIGVVTGVIGNILFAVYLQKWLSQ